LQGRLFSLGELAGQSQKQLATLTPEGLKKLAKLKRLQTLNLSGTPVTDEVLESLAELESLQRLGLADTRVTNRGLEALARFHELQELNLTKTRVTDQGMEALVHLHNLQGLNLARTQVTDKGLEALARLKDLRGLDLDESSVTDEGLKHLRVLDKLKSLRLWKTGVTDEGVAQLKAALLGLEVSWDDRFPFPSLLEPKPFAPVKLVPPEWPVWLQVLGPAGILTLVAGVFGALFRAWFPMSREANLSAGTREQMVPPEGVASLSSWGRTGKMASCK
jgi:hypothetical protein